MTTEYDAKAKDIARLALLVGKRAFSDEGVEAFAILLRLLPDCEALQAIRREVEILLEVQDELYRALRAQLPRTPDEDIHDVF
jgi:hypothetical protein